MPARVHVCAPERVAGLAPPCSFTCACSHGVLAVLPLPRLQNDAWDNELYSGLVAEHYHADIWVESWLHGRALACPKPVCGDRA